MIEPILRTDASKSCSDDYDILRISIKSASNLGKNHYFLPSGVFLKFEFAKTLLLDEYFFKFFLFFNSSFGFFVREFLCVKTFGFGRGAPWRFYHQMSN